MNLETIGLIMIAIGIGGVGFMRITHHIHNKDVDMSEMLDDHLRLEQLRSISGGGSLAQLARLQSIRGKQLKICKDRKSFESLLRDRILLSQEIDRLTKIEIENESSLFIQRASI